MRVKSNLTQIPRLLSWAGILSLLCFGLPQKVDAEAFNYEKVHQRALTDEGFRRADTELNEAYVRAMRKLSKEERAKLRQEEKAWLQENAREVQQNSGREVEFLAERTRKRREELERRVVAGSTSGDSQRLDAAPQAALTLAPQKSAALLAGKAAAPDEPAALSAKEPGPRSAEKGKEGGRDAVKTPEQSGDGAKPEEQGWTPRIAANLERVHQKSLKDSEFEAADTALRSLYRQAMQVLGSADREKLRTAEKAWVRQNGMLLQDSREREEAVLKERTLKRKSELEKMCEERRFHEEAAVAAQETVPAANPVKAPAVLELPVEPLASKAVEPAASASEPVPSPPQTGPSVVVEEDSEPGQLTEKGFWMFLASWIFGLTALHYWAFRSVQKNPAKELSRELSPIRLYILSAGCAGTSLSMLSSGGSVVWIAASVFLTLMGLLVVWYAALAVAVLSRDSADMVAASGPARASGEENGN